MLHLCVNRGSGCEQILLEKAQQDFEDREGRIITYVYQSKWISPTVLEDFISGRALNEPAAIGTMILGVGDEIRDSRNVSIVRITRYGDVWRLDLRLLGKTGISVTFPSSGNENYLASY